MSDPNPNRRVFFPVRVSQLNRFMKGETIKVETGLMNEAPAYVECEYSELYLSIELGEQVADHEYTARLKRK